MGRPAKCAGTQHPASPWRTHAFAKLCLVNFIEFRSLDILRGRYKCSVLLRSGMYRVVVARPSVTTLGTDNLVCRPSPASPPQPSRTNLPHSNSFRGHYLISSIQGENCLLENYFYYCFLCILYFYIHNGKLKIRYIFA